MVVVAVVIAAAGAAHADPAADVTAMVNGLKTADFDPQNSTMRLTLFDRSVQVDDAWDGLKWLQDYHVAINGAHVGVAGDGQAAWVGLDSIFISECGGYKVKCPGNAELHVTLVAEKRKTGWVPLVIDHANTIRAKQQAAEDAKLDDVPAKVEGAEDAVKVFTASIGDPKALVASMSARKEVQLFGTENGERYFGDAARAKLAAWKLAFKLRDGVRAGVTASGSLAWVAANVVSTAKVKAGAKPAEYRVLFVYEHAAGKWQLVQAHFSFGWS